MFPKEKGLSCSLGQLKPLTPKVTWLLSKGNHVPREIKDYLSQETIKAPTEQMKFFKKQFS
jgi:hypothetical protein